MMMRQLIVVALVAGSVGGCASAMRRADRPIVFVSTPPGAQVTTTRGHACPHTPCTIAIPRNEEFDATFTLPGYRPQVVPVRKSFIPTGPRAAVGGGVGFGMIGLGAGAGAGLSYDLAPNPVSVTLEPERPAPAPRRPQAQAPAASRT